MIENGQSLLVTTRNVLVGVDFGLMVDLTADGLQMANDPLKATGPVTANDPLDFDPLTANGPVMASGLKENCLKASCLKANDLLMGTGPPTAVGRKEAN